MITTPRGEYNLHQFVQVFMICHELTHWGLNKMAAIRQTTFWNAFPWMKIVVFWLKFHWNLFLKVQLRINHHCLRWWLGIKQTTSHYLNQWRPRSLHIYASSNLNEFIQKRLQSSISVEGFWTLFQNKDCLPCYRDFHHKDKMVGLLPFYFNNGNTYIQV